MTFANPNILWLLFLLLPLIAWYVFNHNKTQATAQISTFGVLGKTLPTLKTYLRHLPFALRTIAIALLIIVLARPQSTDNWKTTTTEGIDIIIAIDVSTSMLARDFKPDRLEASKELAIEFIENRSNDRIGVVVFAGESYTQCPPTTDHGVLIRQIKDIKTGTIEDGTAIGVGVATAINRIKESDAASKVIILLTDGVNNQGDISPTTSSEIAQQLGVRVYTVGVGSIGTAPYPFHGPFGTAIRQVEVEIDEPMLRQMAQDTDGKYFRATNNTELKEIYEQIDQLEKSKIDEKQHTNKQEEFLLLAIIASLLILVELVLRNTILKNLP